MITLRIQLETYANEMDLNTIALHLWKSVERILLDSKLQNESSDCFVICLLFARHCYFVAITNERCHRRGME